MGLTNPRDVVRARRWEGKPFSFKFKYFYSNYPGILIGSVLTFIVSPVIAVARLSVNPEDIYEVSRKYKPTWKVVRDDDPKAAQIIELNDKKREEFPQY